MRKAPIRAHAKTGIHGDVRLALTLAQTEGKPFNAAWILCPWLDRFPRDTGVWLSVLAAHDANGALLEALPSSRKNRPNVYAAVFAVDALRTTTQLIRGIKNGGIGGVINFPSVSFIDGEAGAILNGLSLGMDREIDFLEACSGEGLRIAGVVGSVQSAKRLVKAGVDFLIAHGGPPTSRDKDPSKDIAMKMAAVVRTKRVPVISMSQLLRTHI